MEPRRDGPAEGTVVTTLTAAAVGVGLACGAVGLLSGLSVGRAALLALLVPLAMSAAAAAALGFFMTTSAFDPYPDPPAPPGPEPSLQDRAAAADPRDRPIR